MILLMRDTIENAKIFFLKSFLCQCYLKTDVSSIMKKDYTRKVSF